MEFPASLEGWHCVFAGAARAIALRRAAWAGGGRWHRMKRKSPSCHRFLTAPPTSLERADAAAVPRRELCACGARGASAWPGAKPPPESSKAGGSSSMVVVSARARAARRGGVKCTFQFHAPCRQPRRKLGEHAVWRALPHAGACAWGALVWGVLWLHRRGLARGGDEEVRSGRGGPGRRG